MPECKKCNDYFPFKVDIDGKRRNLKNRKYCLKCSPFNSHNTKKLHEIEASGIEIRKKICIQCNKDLPLHQMKGRRCWNCLQKERVERVRDKVYQKVGNECWVCGYDKGDRGRNMMDFHHIDPSDKCFGLCARNMCNLSWDRVWTEIKKCILVCCRCHREIEYGLISRERAGRIYCKMWSNIND